jgi:hypothetical protein
MSLRINGSVLGKRNVPTLSLATGMWNMRAQALYKRDNLWPIAYDPDAAAYFGAVATAGGTVSDAQKTAIDTFFRTGKSDGWYSSLKRMYLPIWAAAAPNAICMTSLTSGTFNGTVTHAAGYIQGDGTTGYLDPGASGNLQTLGLGGDNLHYMVGVSLGGSANSIPIGAWDGNSDRRCQITNEIPANINRFSNPASLNSSTASLTDASLAGVLIGSSTSFSARYIHQRKTSGTTVNSNAVNENRTIPNEQPFILARKNTGQATSFFFDGRIFAASYGLAIAQADAPKFSLAIKNLWETCTGLTLP